MTLQLAFEPEPKLGQRTSTVDRKTERIRILLGFRSVRVQEQFPRALDLKARVLSALSGPLHGVASHLRGTHCPEHWSEMLRGSRTFPLYDLCRLGTSPQREAKQAYLAALKVLADEAGLRLVPASHGESAQRERLTELLRAGEGLIERMREALR